MGRIVLGEMESLRTNAEGQEESRRNVQAGLRDGMAHNLFQGLWELYVELHPDEASTGSATEA
jgi:hypothetical protein